jgi:hypothetical protein
MIVFAGLATVISPAPPETNHSRYGGRSQMTRTASPVAAAQASDHSWRTMACTRPAMDSAGTRTPVTFAQR